MKGLLKFVLMAAVLIFAGLWIMTLAKSCNNPGDSAISKVNDVAGKAGDLAKDGADAVKDGFEDLTSDDDDDEDDEFDDAEFDEDGDEVLDDEDDMDADEDDEASFDDEDDDDLDENVTKNSGGSTSGSSSSGSSGFGNYLVVSGSYLGEANAKKEVRRLKKLGYSNAEVVEFDFSQYHSVCVKRTNSLSEARSVKNQLVNKHSITDAYVHKKRKSKRKG